jgi:hypothetical protein
MTRDQATSLTMIMGGVYLCYSAYFLSSDFSGISNFMRVSPFSPVISVGYDEHSIFVSGI